MRMVGQDVYYTRLVIRPERKHSLEKTSLEKSEKAAFYLKTLILVFAPVEKSTSNSEIRYWMYCFDILSALEKFKKWANFYHLKF